MNQFIESNKPWLSLLGLAVVIVFLALLFRPKTNDFEMSAKQALKLMNTSSAPVSVSDLAGKQLIDIRSSDQFLQGHPENSINIPERNLLDKESIEILDQLKSNGTMAVICGSSELHATGSWLLLQQLGYHNLKFLKGAITITNDFRESATGNSENSILDLGVFHAETESSDVSVIKPNNQNPKSVVPTRSKSSSGGGC